MAVVELFRDDTYKGISVKLGYGRYSELDKQTGMPNNSITSVKVAPFTKVTLYKDRFFGPGRSVTVFGPKEIPHLSKYEGDLNNEITSAIVERVEPTIKQKLDCCTGRQTSHCAEFQPGSTTCNEAIAGYCSNRLSDPFCKSWFKQHPAYGDAPSINYCRINPTDPYCSCINSKATGIANPKCVDRNCITNGYLTKNMRETPCPSQIDRTMYVNLTNSGVSLASTVPIQQNCGDPYDGARVNTPIVTDNSQPMLSSTVILIIAIVFICIVFIALIAVIIEYDQPSTENNDQDGQQ